MKIKSSYHQERLWFIDKFEAGNLYDRNPVYHNVPLILEIRGEIDADLLEQSVQKVIERHEILRTKIVTIKNSPYQMIEEGAPFQLEMINPEKDRTLSLEGGIEIAIKKAKEPLPLKDSFLWKGFLIPISHDHSLFVLSLHHILVDRTSLEIIAKEIFCIYHARMYGKEPELPKLPFQYADFSEWQRNLPDDFIESLLFYWKRKLKGRLQPLELPMDHPRAPIHIYHEGHIAFTINGAVYDEVKQLSRKTGIDQSVILMSVYKLLLYRYSGLEEIVIGTSLLNRRQPGTENIVGPVANLVPLRDFISSDDSFYTLLQKVNQTMNEAVENQDLPFDRLVLEINPKNDMSRTALFDVLFQYETKSPLIKEVPGIEVHPVEINLGWGKYDLNLLIQDNGRSFSGVMVYNDDYYNRSTIKRFVNHYRNLLEHAVKSSEREIALMPFLSKQEERTLLFDWNSSQAEYPDNLTIHELFEEQVEKTPGKIAVVFDKTALTYNELNRKANQLAKRIRQKGIKPDSIVGLLIEKSVEMIIGILGVIKAGGAYLPIDPHCPEERINYLLKDSNAGLLLTTRNLIPKVSTAITMIDLNDQKIYHGEGSNLPNRNKPNDLLYVIYTSGTTGQPKGVMIEHRNLLSLMRNDRFQFDFTSDDVWTMFHSYNFDFSVWEMYGALLFGGKLIVIPKRIAQDPSRYLDILRSESVTILNQTPSAFYHLLNEEMKLNEGDLRLRYIIFGGEALNPVKLKGWKERYPETRLINMYGITETTVHVTYKEITADDIARNISNIGRPIPTLNTYVFDRNMRLLPIGIMGELCVGGDGVARGYLHRPELSSERFIQNPYKPQERLYRSGDLARMLDNGEMEYCGRIDHQMKIRGFRIEPGEIESNLLKSSLVKEAAVSAHEDTQGNKRLIAYIVWAEGGSGSVSLLREFLGRHLPDYMIPSAFISMEQMPVTPNGKIDRKAFPEPRILRYDSEREYIAPRNTMESTIAQIWKDILNIDKVGINDDFFLLGGNSLLVTQVIFKIFETYGIDIPLQVFFVDPTISGMAGYLETVDSNKGLVEKQRSGINFEKELHLDDAIEGSWAGNPKPAAGIKNAFITGVTGFLGSFLLKELLKTTDANAFCLVRASNEKEAMRRIDEALHFYRIDLRDYRNRIIPITGDLALPFLGIEERKFCQLSEMVDVIYHNGAIAHFIYPYPDLKGANVKGTKEILRFASMSQIKPVHYISTISVFHKPRKALVTEDEFADIDELYDMNGYGQSKWVAEGLIRKARQRGIPVNIYRPGRISGHTETGACQTNDFLWKVIKASLEVGSVFDRNIRLDMVPVDYVSKAVIHISVHGEYNKNYHLISEWDVPLSMALDWVLSLGFEVQSVPYGTWVESIRDAARNHKEGVCAEIATLLPQEPNAFDPVLRFDNLKTRTALTGANLPAPRINEVIFKRNIQFLIESGFVRAPEFSFN